MFPCSETSLDGPTCVSELQFCDGVPDCTNGTDEPADCKEGILNLATFIFSEVLNMYASY